MRLNLIDQQKIRIGSCAWSFDDWRGVFYPHDLPESHWLQFYAQYFPTIEVDSTFHAAPAENSVLGQKLQVILIQLPPSLTPDDGKQALRKFLVQLPRDLRFAIEFRHAGWHRPQFIRLLEKYRICWVWTDTTPLNERNLAPFEFLPCTADFVYLRLLGDYATKYDVDGGHVHRYGKLLWKREAALESWSLKIQRHFPDVRSVWAFAGNHFEGFAPETCQRLAQRLGFDLALPSQCQQAFSADTRSQLDLDL
ncbi:MAG: hypothetical protein DME85_05965 [Verrucomicrobia bacterium]|nr:MAG: hypothetical protein DME85_05965 [Verrucomicrobiota bacterium]